MVLGSPANNGTHQITTDPMAHTVAGSNLRQDVGGTTDSGPLIQRKLAVEPNGTYPLTNRYDPLT